MSEKLQKRVKALIAGGGVFCVLLALAAGREASAATPEGSYLTNIAFASYQKTDGSPRTVTFNATFAVFVKTPNVMTRKTAFPPMQAPGGYVYYCISFVNTSAYTTAFNVVISDELSDSMSFIGRDAVIDHEYIADPAAVLTPGYTLDGGANWTDGARLNDGQVGGPLVKMRWAINELAPGKSGLLCFRAKVL